MYAERLERYRGQGLQPSGPRGIYLGNGCKGFLGTDLVFSWVVAIDFEVCAYKMADTFEIERDGEVHIIP